jgi:diguanylate cyclase (GGDEF)-like protein/PAS domain S-box-containing protein
MNTSRRPMNRRAAVALLGGALALVALAMMAGWAFRQAWLVSLPSGSRMVFGTALAFAVCGLALVAGVVAPSQRSAVKTFAGALLIALGMLTLAEYLLGVGLGIDAPGLHAWLADPERNPFPGRSSRVTAVGFVLAGLVFLAVPRARSVRAALAVRTLTLVLAALGVFAATGHALSLPDMPAFHWLMQVSLPAALCFIVIALAFWLDWHAESWSALRIVQREDERIAIAGAVVLAACSAVVALAVYWPMQSAVEGMLSEELMVGLKARRELLLQALDRVIERTVQVSQQPHVQRIYAAPSRQPGAADHPAMLAMLADGLVRDGFSGLAFLDAQGRERSRVGQFVDASPLHLPLRRDDARSELLWNGSALVLEVRADIVVQGQRLGEVRAQQQLEPLNTTMTEAAPMGIPVELVLCAARAALLHCAPSLPQQQPFDMPATQNGQRLPMSYALDGGTGIIQTNDYRGREVIAAYAPMLGAGLVLKADLAALHAPIRSRAWVLVLTVLLAITGGSLILRKSVRPLARRLLSTREQLRVAIEGSHIAMWNLNLETSTFDRNEQWAAMLGGAPQALETPLASFHAMVHPDDLPALRETMWAGVRHDGTFSADYRVRHASGQWHWIRSRGQVVERARDGRPLRVIGTSVDISEDKRAEHALHELNRELKALSQSNEIAAAVIRTSGEGVMVIGADLCIKSVNPAFEAITGYTSAQAVGHNPKLLFSGRHDAAFFAAMREQLNTQGSWQGEVWNRRRNGEIYPQQTSLSVLRDPQGNISHYASVLRDRSHEYRLEAELRSLATQDGLTGIANRRTFDDVLAREWARALRDGRPLSLLMIDIDYFKRYNDRFGHPAGDECLRRVAQAIAGAVGRASDQAARYGGEEFALILPNTDAAAAALVAEKVRSAVAALGQPHPASDAAAFVTVSIGAATVTPTRMSNPTLQHGDAATLVAQADKALYQAKAGGRNRVFAAEPGSGEEVCAPVDNQASLTS